MTIGFNFTSKEIYYVVLDGTKAQPIFQTKNKIVLPENYDVPRTVEWFETELNLILNSIQPNIASYRLTINRVTNDYVTSVYYGQAILNLLCRKKNIQISHCSPSAIVASKFNQPKGTDLHHYLDQIIGVHAPHWNDKMRDAALIALNLLP